MEQKIIANQMSVSQQQDGHWLTIQHKSGKEYCLRIEGLRDKMLREALVGWLEDKWAYLTDKKECVNNRVCDKCNERLTQEADYIVNP